MAAIICKEHGRQLAVLVCPHIEERHNRKEISQDIMPVRGSTVVPNLSAELFLCCSECFVKYGFAQQNGDIGDADVPEEFGNGLSPICHLCFEAWRNKEARGHT